MADSDDNLERLNAVVNEIEAHNQRLQREAKLNRATASSIMQEVTETVMPLLKDFAVRAFAEVIAVRSYIHEHVEPALLRLNETDSLLLPEDAALIMQRLLSYREMLDGLSGRAVGDDKTKLVAELAEVDRVLARVAEITLEEEDEDDDPKDPDAEPEDDEDERPAADSN